MGTFITSTGKTLRLDDRVRVIDEVARAQDRGTVYEVTAFAVKNVTIKPVSGGRGVVLKPEFLIHADEAPDTGAVVTFVPLPEYLEEGTVVKCKTEVAAKRMNISPDVLLVVTGTARGGEGYRISYLGGDPDKRGRYWPKISPAMLQIVPLDQINR